MHPRIPLIAATMLLSVLSKANAEAKNYRYSIGLCSGESRYAGEISREEQTVGPSYRVETDAKGRIIKTTEYQDGRLIAAYNWHYPSSSSQSDGFSGARGALSWKGRIHRDMQGRRTRTDIYTTPGTLTRYSVRDYSHDVSVRNYSATGKELSRAALSCDFAGIVVWRATLFFNNGSRVSLDFDESTGELRRHTDFNGKGEAYADKTYTYDAHGDIRRADIYDSTGSRYGAEDYVSGLIRSRTYWLKDGTTKMSTMEYDTNGVLRQTKLSINERLICTFRYERLPDGTPIRTLAEGPSGDLWAEYPDDIIIEVDKQGKSLSGFESIVYHVGDWW